MEWVRQFQAGDAQAFNRLVEKHHRTVLNLVYRFTGSAREAEDLAQEVFLRVFRALPGFKGQARFMTWVYRITFNLCIRERGRRARREARTQDQESEEAQSLVEGLAQPGPSPDEHLVDKELEGAVRLAINRLPEDQRAVVILRRFDDLSYEEIAQVLNLSLPAVKSRLHRARAALKEMLTPYLEHSGRGPGEGGEKP